MVGRVFLAIVRVNEKRQSAEAVPKRHGSREWSGDGGNLLYLVARDGGMNIWRQPIAGGPAIPVTRFTDERIFRFSASPDQQRWAIVRGTITSDVVLVSERP